MHETMCPVQTKKQSNYSKTRRKEAVVSDASSLLTPNYTMAAKAQDKSVGAKRIMALHLQAQDRLL